MCRSPASFARTRNGASDGAGMNRLNIGPSQWLLPCPLGTAQLLRSTCSTLFSVWSTCPLVEGSFTQSSFTHCWRIKSFPPPIEGRNPACRSWWLQAVPNPRRHRQANRHPGDSKATSLGAGCGPGHSLYAHCHMTLLRSRSSPGHLARKNNPPPLPPRPAMHQRHKCLIVWT
jgi:hypothetical protein